MSLVHVASNQALPRAADGLPAAREPFLTREGLERDLLSLYEQLLATRLELGGAVPAGGPLTLSRGELECVLAQLDSAIISARYMVSSAVRVPEEPPRVFDIQPAYGPRDGTYRGARAGR